MKRDEGRFYLNQIVAMLFGIVISFMASSFISLIIESSRDNMISPVPCLIILALISFLGTIILGIVFWTQLLRFTK